MNKKTAKKVMRAIKRVATNKMDFGDEVQIVIKKERSTKKRERTDKR